MRNGICVGVYPEPQRVQPLLFKRMGNCDILHALPDGSGHALTLLTVVEQRHRDGRFAFSRACNGKSNFKLLASQNIAVRQPHRERLNLVLSRQGAAQNAVYARALRNNRFDNGGGFSVRFHAVAQKHYLCGFGMGKHIPCKNQRRRNVRRSDVRLQGVLIQIESVAQVVGKRHRAHGLQAEGDYAEAVNVGVGHFYDAAHEIVLRLFFFGGAVRSVHHQHKLVFRVVHLVIECHARQHENTQDKRSQVQHDGGNSVSCFSEFFRQLEVRQKRKKHGGHNKQQQPCAGKIHL